MRLTLGLVRVALVAAMVLASFAAMAVKFPALTGRVVDDANVIAPQARSLLETKLKDLEDKSGIQLVVATVPSLEDQDIEPYANGLFRAWKLGEKQKNNGVLLLVAPRERKVRIEVGYGLEGTLTDAISKLIITNAIVPRFKANDYSGGIDRGVDDIIAVLTTDSADWQARPHLRVDDQPSLIDAAGPLLVLIIFAILFLTMMHNARNSGGRIVRRGGNTIFIPWAGPFGSGPSGGGSSWGGGDSGGGFSGGGGSSGGGGASGGW
jgi:uncharacterized protein